METKMPNTIQRTTADWLNNNELDRLSREMSDLQKLVATLAIAVSVTLIVGAILMIIEVLVLNWMFGFGLFTFLTAFFGSFGLSSWLFMINGAYRNGELERATGGVGGQLTSWILPTGLSWWIPRRLGGSQERKLNVEIRELNRTKDKGKPLEGVVTYDGAEIGVEYFTQYRVTDIEKARQYTNIDTAFAALMDRHARFFANEWDGDPATTKSLTRRKTSFSNWMSGQLPVKNRKGEDMQNDIIAEAAAMGVELVSSRITDINPPKELVEARKAKIRERAEGEAERANIVQLRRQVRGLRKGYSKDDEALDITDREALEAAQLARKDVRKIIVGGDAGDFTKGHVGARALDDK